MPVKGPDYTHGEALIEALSRGDQSMAGQVLRAADGLDKGTLAALADMLDSNLDEDDRVYYPFRLALVRWGVGKPRDWFRTRALDTQFARAVERRRKVGGKVESAIADVAAQFKISARRISQARRALTKKPSDPDQF